MPDIIPNIVPPVESPVVETPKVEMPSVQVTKVEGVKVEEPKVEVPNEVTPETPSINIPNMEEKKMETPSSIGIKPVSEITVNDIQSTPVTEPVAILPTPEPVEKPVEVSIPVTPVIPTPAVPPMPETVSAPVVESPVVSTPIQTPVEKKENVLVFDGSKESNLNEALGEVSNDKTVLTQNVEPIREFGVDEVKSVEKSEPVVNTTQTNTNGKMAGFANNKFFMVIAILFFVSACVFLGYEAFKYFSLVK